VKYFAKDMVKYIPFFGWGVWILGSIFLSRSWLKDNGRINNKFQAIIQSGVMRCFFFNPLILCDFFW